jgi:hypothetical protein
MIPFIINISGTRPSWLTILAGICVFIFLILFGEREFKQDAVEVNGYESTALIFDS